MATTPTKKGGYTPYHARTSNRTPSLLSILLGALLAVALGAGGTWIYWAEHTHAYDTVGVVGATTPGFLALEPIRVNLLSDDGEQHYLRATLNLKYSDPAMLQRLHDHLPEFRSRLLLALSNKHPDDLSSTKNKRALSAELKALVEQPTDKGYPAVKIDDVLFTEFVVQ